ncbi:MAG: NAD-binding protein [Magnetococcales bacterium]|nr:NAD-binding protein [Magnetococcales bacterium]
MSRFIRWLDQEETRYRRIKRFFYSVVEYQHSTLNQIFNVLMICLVMASVVVMVLEVDPDVAPWDQKFYDFLEDLFIGVFLIEYLLRWWVCSDLSRDFLRERRRAQRRWHRYSLTRLNLYAARKALIVKLRWMVQPMSLVDLVAILPVFRPFRLLRVLRVLRVLKLFRYSQRLSFFTGIIADRSYELMSLLMMAVVSWGMVAVAFFVVERGHNENVTTVWESVYWSIITITTVGYGDITPATTAGRVIAVLGTIFGMWVAVFMTSIIVAALTERIIYLREHRMERMIDRLDDHFIVCGLDALGRAVCRTLEEEQKQFVAIDTDLERVEMAQKSGWNALSGDITEEDVWEKLGLRRARAVISSVVDESVNVYIILMVREQRPDCFMVACGADDKSKKRLKRVGADRVITPFQVGGRQMALTALRPSAVQLFDMALKRDHVELEMEELEVPDGSCFDGLQLKDSDIRQGYDVIIVGIATRDGEMRFNPRANERLSAGDVLICLGHLDDLERLRNALLEKTERAGIFGI